MSNRKKKPCEVQNYIYTLCLDKKMLWENIELGRVSFDHRISNAMLEKWCLQIKPKYVFFSKTLSSFHEEKLNQEKAKYVFKRSGRRSSRRTDNVRVAIKEES